jgi:hypothetical protein
MAQSLLDCFKMDATYVADQLTFDRETGTITAQFANADDFCDSMEDKLGSEDKDNLLMDCLVRGAPKPHSLFEISADTKASLVFALNNPDMDLAANCHAGTKSQRTNFSSSTGNSTNRSVSTKKFAMNHKAQAIALAKEVKHAAKLEHEHCKMAC